MKMRFQFEATDYGNVLFGEVDDLKIVAKITVPHRASEDYGYLTLKKAVEEKLHTMDMDVDATFPYDGQEQYLAEDADIDAVTMIYIID